MKLATIADRMSKRRHVKKRFSFAAIIGSGDQANALRAVEHFENDAKLRRASVRDQFDREAVAQRYVLSPRLGTDDGTRVASSEILLPEMVALRSGPRQFRLRCHAAARSQAIKDT